MQMGHGYNLRSEPQRKWLMSCSPGSQCVLSVFMNVFPPDSQAVDASPCGAAHTFGRRCVCMCGTENVYVSELRWKI